MAKASPNEMRLGLATRDKATGSPASGTATDKSWGGGGGSDKAPRRVGQIGPHAKGPIKEMPGSLVAQGHAHLEEGLPFPRSHKAAIWACEFRGREPNDGQPGSCPGTIRNLEGEGSSSAFLNHSRNKEPGNGRR